jgi:hypothetical protein
LKLLNWLKDEGFQWYRYKDPTNICQLGTLETLMLDQLLLIDEDDLLLAGKMANLSQFIILK